MGGVDKMLKQKQSLKVKEAIQACLDGSIVLVNQLPSKTRCYVQYIDGFYYSFYEDLTEKRKGFSFDSGYEYMLCEPPKPKKKYWIWDIDVGEGAIEKESMYLDEYGCQTNGKSWIESKSLIKKHEDEWVEV